MIVADIRGYVTGFMHVRKVKQENQTATYLSKVYSLIVPTYTSAELLMYLG